jgi:hypothetical protein
MAKSEAPKTSKLVFTASNGDEVTVSVADDKVDNRVAGGMFAKPAARRSSTSS